MKKKTYIKLMTVTVLASTLLLGACGNKKETTQASSSAKTSQSSSSKATSSNKESKTQKSSSSALSEKAKASTDQSSASATPSQATPAPEQRQGHEVSNQQVASQQTPAQAPSTQQGSQAQSNQSSYNPTTDRKLQDKQAEQNKRYKGILTMVDGDFSAAAGNWKGANGETITVSSGGQFTVESSDGKKENYSLKGYSYTLDDGKYNAKIGGGKIIQITTGADGKVSSVALSQ
ncbi:hypothetical protein [Streptococcus sp. 20925_1_69]|uniref:hypothetical protein n=1 Tax=Streptococcus sp. 20925_1_69 TaxID=3003661 RepID=UPI00352D80C7